MTEMLGSAGRAAPTAETDFMRLYWSPWRRRRGRGERDDWLGLLGSFTASEAFRLAGLSADRFVEDLKDGPRDALAILRLFLRRVVEAQGAELVLEKTPGHVRFIRQLRRAFPAARFLHVVRDPRATVHSWKSVPWPTKDIDAIADAWRSWVRRGRLAENLGNVTVVRYEELVHRPGTVLKAVCERIGLEAQVDAMIRRASGPRSFDPRREPWKRGAIEPLDVGRAQRWRTELTPGEIVRIEGAVWDEMIRYGFERLHPPSRLLYPGFRALVRRNLGRGVRLLGKARRRMGRGDRPDRSRR